MTTATFTCGTGYNDLTITHEGESLTMRFHEGINTPNYWASGQFVKDLTAAYCQMEIDALDDTKALSATA